MIITRTPLRMSYVGGGTDIGSFYRQYPGAVVSTSIDKYIYVTLHTRFEPGVRCAYSKTEEVITADKLQHPLVREALDLMGITSGVEITSTADIPASGSGLGSSSSYTVGLLRAIAEFLGKPMSPPEIAELACDIEIDRCGEPIGKQDQYAAAVGGMNVYQFNPDESVNIIPVVCSSHFKNVLNESTIIFYTGMTRAASSILAEQTENSAKTSKQTALRRMADMAFEFKAGVEDSDLPLLGELLIENWSLKKSLASGIANSEIDEIYSLAMKAGAIGGKLLGAGAGGFMMFLASPDRHSDIESALSGYRRVSFRMDELGSQLIYKD